jgi:hypothetical protein
MASTVSGADCELTAFAPHRLSAWLSATDAFGPALIVALVLGLLVIPGLAIYRGNPTGFVRFGREWAGDIRPPPGAVVETKTGYDGQFFWAQAQDPLLLRDRTVAAFKHAGFRLGRVAYPALAYVLAAGWPSAIPWTLLAINALMILGVTIAFSQYARRRGWSGWWGLAVGLLPGFMFATLGDLSDVLAVASMLGGLMMWQQRRRWPAAGLLTLAVLAREPMLLAAAAVAVDACVGAWRSHRHGSLRVAISSLWPAAAVPVLAFGAWQAYVHVRYGGSTADPASAFQPPFVGIVDEVRRALGNGPAVSSAWDLAYLALMLAGLGAAVALVRRSVSAPAIAACLFAISLLVLTFGNDWSYTRLSAPLFACLLLGGLERRVRAAIGVCVAVAALGALVPFAIG